jgi:hypothetical protein
MAAHESNEPASRWISVIFLQGDDADEVLGMLDRTGVAATIEYLQQWDYGDETTDAALINGYVYDRIPAGSTDRTIEDDGSPYALTYSVPFGYVSLLRRYPAPEPEHTSATRVPTTQPARARQAAESWASARGRSASKSGRAVAL